MANFRSNPKEDPVESSSTAVNRIDNGGRAEESSQDGVNLVELAKDIYTIRSTIHNPELILNEKWQIIGYSNSFLLLTEGVINLAQRRASLNEFLTGEDFEKIMEYQRTVDRLEHLPYDQGRGWEVRYEGPESSDRIGETWLCSAGEDENLWDIAVKRGRRRLRHRARLADLRDCYAMYHQGFGSAEEDIRLEFTARTSRRKKHIMDVSAIISGSPGRVSNFPDISGYTICTGSYSNRVSRMQRAGVDIVSRPEPLRPRTDYNIRIERTGGRLTRWMTDLSSKTESEPLMMIDPHAVYDVNNCVGFTTYSGDLDIYDIKVFTRKSMFSLEQFKLTFDLDVHLRDPGLAGRVFKIKIGRDVRANKSLTRLMFEDITERMRIENELKQSRQQLRELALHLQMIREQERRVIAREIHDELGQALTALQLDLYGLKKRFPGERDDLKEKADSMLRLIDVTNRSVQRISTHLRPALLDDLGLTAAIEWQIEEFSGRTGITCELNLEAEDSSLDEELSTAIFRILQETLTNITRHAEATKAWVSLVREDGTLILEVRDNGKGITRGQVEHARSFGVIGMRERLYPWGGEVDICGEKNKGTMVKVRIKLPEENKCDDQDSDS
ncbi:MAG: sensor histidine kinase [Candidatus Glassbacteria bacterium]|nr:sensor histidine kinase [Candidatus Glassbacteria bacterium]